MADNHANGAYSTLANSPGSAGTAFTVATGEGSRFPAAPFNVVMWPAGAVAHKANMEVGRCTAIVADALTVTRTQESSTNQNVVAGYQIAVAPTAKVFTDIETDLLTRGYGAETFGCVGDDSTDNATAIAAAIAAMPATGGVLHFGPGIFRIASNVSFAKAVTFVGAGRYATIFKTTSATLDMFTATSTCNFLHCGFTSSVTRTAGSYIKLNSAINSHIADVNVSKYYTAFTLVAATGTRITDVLSLADATPAATSAGGAFCNISGLGADIHLNRCTVNNSGGDPTYGIVIADSLEVNIVECEIIHHGNGLAIIPGAGQVAAGITAIRSYFDNCATRGIWINPAGAGSVVRCQIGNSWIGNSVGNGVEIGSTGTIREIHFNDCEFTLNGTHGMIINGGTDIHVLGGWSINNTTDGFRIAANVSKFSIANARIGDGGGLSGNGGWGINVLAGTSDQYRITGNDCTGNTLGAITDNGTGTQKTVEGNLPIGQVVETQVRTLAQGSVLNTSNSAAFIDIISLVVKANTVAIVNRTLRWRAFGEYKNNDGANTHTIAGKVIVATTAVVQSNASAAIAASALERYWEAWGEVRFISATTALASMNFRLSALFAGVAGAAGSLSTNWLIDAGMYGFTGVENFAVDWTFKFQLQMEAAVATVNIQRDGYTVELL